ncbi:MAG: (Fe-S)-binding protein [Deltaproteobacteria bacterium]|nr:(Fe-S)-binding protein [Deltaproteobacteria bacterium]
MKSTDRAKRFSENFKQRITRQQALALAACAHCGICADSCHYYKVTGDPKMTPAYKADRIRRVFKRQFDWTGRFIPWWVGAEAVSEDEQLEELKEIFFGCCTGCRRCTINCPFGVDMAGLVSLTRSLLIDENMGPTGLIKVMRDQWTTGNQMAISDQDYLETLRWLQEEVREELDDPGVTIPVDKKGADFLYIVNPREIKYAPMSLMAATKIFHSAGLNWTMGSKGWDNTNYGLFSGKADLGRHMCNLAFTQAKILGVKQLVVSECGHGFRSMKWEAPIWGVKVETPIQVVSVLQLLAELISRGIIALDPRRNPLPVTYHDPCSLSRSSGLTEEPRYCLRRACLDFREMTPNRINSYCCTGGGGALSMTEYTPLRLRVTRIKASQIAATGAVSVVTSCHNCADGLADVIKANKLTAEVEPGVHRPVTVRTVCDCVANALILDSVSKQPLEPSKKL